MVHGHIVAGADLGVELQQLHWIFSITVVNRSTISSVEFRISVSHEHSSVSIAVHSNLCLMALAGENRASGSEVL